MSTIHISQFGPIINGQVELKPLTIFVGPNNSGKSYFAVLIYSLVRSIFYPPGIHMLRLSRGVRSAYSRFWGFGKFAVPDIIESKEFADLLKEALQPYLTDAKRGEVLVPITSLPDRIREGFLQTVTSYTQSIVSHLAEEIQRCWAVEIPDLVRKTSVGPRRRTFKISLEQTKPHLTLEIKSVGEGLEISKLDVEPSDLHITLDRSFVFRMRREPELWLYELLDGLLRQVFSTSLFLPYYLPAARSGILQNHKALASSAVSRATMVGIRHFPEIPLFPGVVADFISNIIELEKRKPKELNQVASLLESNVMRGVIDIEESKKEYPELYYGSKVGKFELHRTSSMISELAPVALFLKYVINPGNLLIIEEPESHLHPENQRRMARVIVRLVRAKVNVLITTHSDYFVEQLNNFIRLAKGSEEERRSQQYSAEDFLKPEEVGAYLFDLDEQREGTLIKRLSVSGEDGIATDAFAKVTESLYEQTVSLDRIAKK